jgi:hypothetical protein
MKKNVIAGTVDLTINPVFLTKMRANASKNAAVSYPIRSGAQTKSELLTTINPMVAQSLRSSGFTCWEGRDLFCLWLMIRTPNGASL